MQYQRGKDPAFFQTGHVSERELGSSSNAPWVWHPGWPQLSRFSLRKYFSGRMICLVGDGIPFFLRKVTSVELARV